MMQYGKEGEHRAAERDKRGRIVKYDSGDCFNEVDAEVGCCLIEASLS
jgi:hypothetical protein